MPMRAKEYMKAIREYIEGKGFHFEEGTIENFYLCLKTKPFVILAGISGTGKSKLCRLFAEAIGAEFKLVPVRPDWSDSSELFGHVDLNGHFLPGAILDFVKSAQDHPGKPYILCLDEMNLARVEYYLSDFLSVMETRELKNGTIVSHPLVERSLYGRDTAAAEHYGELSYPDNLYLVGTVNMDETTFSFSKKVLDRANTIEFHSVDLVPVFDVEPDGGECLSLPNSFLRSEFLLMQQCGEHADYVRAVCGELQRFHELLRPANAHFGYRVRDEIVFYLLNNRQEGGLLPEQTAMDNAICQKILPRIQGSSASVWEVLCGLFRICGGDHTQQFADRDSARMQKVLDDPKESCPYPQAAQKLCMMFRRLEEDGFTSYWL